MSNVVPLVPGAPVVPIPAPCRFCDGPLPAHRFVYCSERCKKKWRNRGRNKRVPAICEHCKQACTVWASSTGGQPGRFCSAKCGAAFARESGMFKGERNPRWLGGVSKDNMRYRRRQQEKWPEREAARRAVQHAVRSGALVRQPCEVCGATEKVEAHHDDYAKPLDVRWLCNVHHDEHHAAEKARSRAAGRATERAAREATAAGRPPPLPVRPEPAPPRAAFGAFWWRGKLRRSA